MIFKKYNPDRRDSIVLCMPDCEELTSIRMDNKEQIKTTLESKYKSLIIDSPPYNYIVYSGGFFELKSPDIAHSDKSFLAAYNDDVKILLLDSDFLNTKMEEIIEILVNISCRYSMSLKDSLKVATLNMTTEISTQLDIILKEAVVKRNTVKPIMSIRETIVNGEIVLNDNIITRENRRGINKLSVISDRYLVPATILTELNPHIDPENILITDTIFLPSTLSIAATIKANSTVKEAQYIYDTCSYIIEKGVGVDG